MLGLSKRNPREYAVDLRRSPGASLLRRDPPNLVERELARYGVPLAAQVQTRSPRP
jgi:hypothetical protein